MEAALNSVDEGILMLDAHGQIRLANESIYAITHVPREELVGKNLGELPAARLAAIGYTSEEVQELLPMLMLGYLPSTPKTMIKTPATPEKHILERLASPVWDANERLVGWMILLRDVTAEYRVAESRELVTETMVHDLRSPLSVILGALDVISGAGADSPSTDPETIAEAMSIARRSAQRVLSLVESLLDIARLQTGNMETTLVPTHLNVLADNVLSELLPQAQDYGISLTGGFSARARRRR
jgi:signal transduction histidine kinase